MALTILDLIQKVGQQAVNFRTDALGGFSHITLVSNISPDLHPMTDFNVNGDVTISDTVANVIKKYGDKTITEFMGNRQMKVMWSNGVIVASDESAAFLPALVLRVLSTNDELNQVDYIALRNKFGASATQMTYLDPNKK